MHNYRSLLAAIEGDNVIAARKARKILPSLDLLVELAAFDDRR